jgi:hypothetical protein
MARYTLRKGKRYRATISLGLFQGVASNETVADKFREAGFTEVDVAGSGRMGLAPGSGRTMTRAPRSPTRSPRSPRSRSDDQP